ncbi:hypothetical protein MMC25_007222 [Agyrium rufum]|nr:hypothetical protein [Agyrium rufum]
MAPVLRREMVISIRSVAGVSRSIPRRQFWWGRHGYTSKYPSGTCNSKSWKVQQYIKSSRASRSSPKPLYSMRGNSLYEVKGSNGWRLLSSLGKSDGQDLGDRASDRKRTTEERMNDIHDEYQREFEKRQEQIVARYKEIKRRCEEDPIGVLFGPRNGVGAWNPWEWYHREMHAQGNTSGGTVNEPVAVDKEGKNASTTASERPVGFAQDPLPRSGSKQTSENASEEYVYDPISQRRIPRETMTEPSDRSKPPTETFTSKLGVPMPKAEKTIPVKRGHGPSAISPSRQDPDANAAQQPVKQPSTTKELPKLRIESTLERQLRANEKAMTEAAPPSSFVRDTSKSANRENLVDLTANNIRAAFDKMRESFKQSEVESAQRRQKLQDEFEKRFEALEKQFAKEVSTGPSSLAKGDVAGTGAKSIQSATSSSLDSETLDDQFSTKEMFDRSEKEMKQIELQMQAEEAAYAREEEERMQIETEEAAKRTRKIEIANSKLDQEVRAQKAAMNAIETRRLQQTQAEEKHSSLATGLGEGDMNIQILEFADRARWYKRNAPHASQEESKLVKEREEQKARDRNLVRELRSIYEDDYGTIDTKHRQKQESSEKPVIESKLSSALTMLPARRKNTIAGYPKYAMLVSHLHEVAIGHLQIARIVHNAATSGQSLAARQSLPVFKHYLESVLTTYDAVLALLPASMETRLHKLREQIALTGSAASPPETSQSTNSTSSEQDVPVAESATTSFKPVKQSYKIIALDNHSNQVTSVSTTSSLYESSAPPRSAASILSHLKHPAKFISFIEELQDSRFELVAGNRHMLIYKDTLGPQTAEDASAKQVQPPAIIEAHAPEKAAKSTTHIPIPDKKHINPVDGTTAFSGEKRKPSTPNPISRGDEHDIEPAEAFLPPTSTPIHRQEPVFSGQALSGADTTASTTEPGSDPSTYPPLPPTLSWSLSPPTPRARRREIRERKRSERDSKEEKESSWTSTAAAAAAAGVAVGGGSKSKRKSRTWRVVKKFGRVARTAFAVAWCFYFVGAVIDMRRRREEREKAEEEWRRRNQ